MSDDLRNSLKLWAGGIAFIAIFWALLRSDVLKGLTEEVPSQWFWIVIGVIGIWNIAQMGFCLWQRRASNPQNPNGR